uniref:Integrase core domain containing protein n=1 Tax=Solanum tuberosum TaxID=4113 RepID=M1DH48_SOLTU
MSEAEVNGSQEGHRDSIDDINSAYNPSQPGEMDVIFLSPTNGNARFEVTSMTLYLLQMRGLYGGRDHKDPHEDMRHFIENYHKEEEQRRYYQEWAEQSDYLKREDDHEEDHTQSSESPKSKGSASNPQVNDLSSHILDKVEGSDDLLKGMEADLSSLNSKVNSHAEAIKILKGQLSLLSAQLKPKITREDDDRRLVVVTRSGKVSIGDVTRNDEEDKAMEEEEIPIHQSIAK